MIQLCAWEYEGKTECGLDFGSSLWTVCYPVGENTKRDKSQVTSLRKVKVVDEDAVQEITSADGLWVHDGKEWRTRYAMWRGKPLKTKEDWDNYYLAINPPVTEPKNFGAIVEAEYIDWKNDKVKTRFTFSGIWWINEKFGNRFKWEFLINPSIISEGVEG